MRILHIIGTVNPEAGGPSEAVRMLVEFAPPDVQSEIVSTDDPAASFVASYGCPVHALGPARTGYLYVAKFLPWLRANATRFDGVIVHGLWTYVAHAARRGLGSRVPYVVFAHGMLDPYFKRTYPLKHWKKWVSWLTGEYWLLRGARHVLFTTRVEEKLAEISFGLWQWNALVAPLGAYAATEATDEAKEAFWRLCPAAKSRRFLLFLGRIHVKKGCDLLVEAFARCAGSDPDLDLVMAGPDTSGWAADLREIAGRAGVGARIHWPGMLKGGVKAAAFNGCEAFCLPSHQENFGIAVVEALAMGRPVLLSDKINIAPEIASDGCGLVEADTLEGTVRLVERWMAMDDAKREAMRQQARITFAARYNMQKNAAAILSVFNATEAPAK